MREKMEGSSNPGVMSQVLKQELQDMLDATGARHCILPAASTGIPEEKNKDRNGGHRQPGRHLPAAEDTESQAVVMRGRLTFHSHSGLSMHCSDGTETQNLSNVSEMPPGLSFDFTFAGRVDFSLGGRRHHLGGSGLLPLECCGFALARPELMSRFTREGAQVRKLNLFVQHHWLQHRCHSDAGRAQLKRLFSHHARPRYWAATPKMVALAQRLMTADSVERFSDQLQLEQITIELLSLCIEAFEPLQASDNGGEEPQAPALYFRLKEQVDTKLRECTGLDDIARALGISVSTLQRKFKSIYGTTVIDYVRRRRLEIARAAITMDGLSIGEAAFQAGYNHPSNFVAAFKKMFQVTPAQLVRSHRKLRKLEPV